MKIVDTYSSRATYTVAQERLLTTHDVRRTHARVLHKIGPVFRVGYFVLGVLAMWSGAAGDARAASTGLDDGDQGAASAAARVGLALPNTLASTLAIIRPNPRSGSE